MAFFETDPARTCDLSFTDTLPSAAWDAMAHRPANEDTAAAPAPAPAEAAAPQSTLKPKFDAGMDVIASTAARRG